MQKMQIFALTAFAVIVACLLLSTVSASIFEPRYETYRLGANGHSGTYSSTSTYEKITTENEDRYGSDSSTIIKRSETETYTPAPRTETRYVFKSDNVRYESPRYIEPTFGRGLVNHRAADVNYGNVYIHYTDDGWLPSSNWRFKEVYHDYDYPNENSYGYDYYYAPRYDWHRGMYNWRY